MSLSRYRAQLGRGRRSRRAEDLLASADAATAIAALPPDELFYVVHELGAAEASPILRHATPEQVQTVLDFAVWDRDTLSPERLGEWLPALVEAPAHTLGSWFRALDSELVALILRTRCRVYDLTREEPPEAPQGVLLQTPDGFFALDARGSDEDKRVTAHLVDALYRADKDWARRMLVGSCAELDSELEEHCYRWRSGRMADLGFIDFYEALEVYREIDPGQVAIGEHPGPRTRPIDAERNERYLRVPGPLAERLSGRSPFARAIAGVTDPEELADLHYAVVALANRVLSADRVTPGDDDAVTAVLGRAVATLDLAVDLLGRGDDQRATAAVRTVPLVRLFQTGASLLGKLRRVGLALRREGPFARLAPGIRLFEPEDDQVLAAVTRLRPMFPRCLDTPPAPGERPFAGLADLAAAGAGLERAGAALALVHALGVRPEHLAPQALDRLHVRDPSALDTGVLARTILVARLAGEAPVPAGRPLQPLSRKALAAFENRFHNKLKKKFNNDEQKSKIKKILSSSVQAIFAAAVPGGALPPGAAQVADRWAASLSPLESVLSRSND